MTDAAPPARPQVPPGLREGGVVAIGRRLDARRVAAEARAAIR
jgi:hypothetical protein